VSTLVKPLDVITSKAFIELMPLRSEIFALDAGFAVTGACFADEECGF
jgi:hypothetical protein